MKKKIILICGFFLGLILLVSCSSSHNGFLDNHGGLDEVASDGCIHDFGYWMQVEASTCIVQGKKQRQCSKCQKIQTEKLDLTDHEYIEAGSIPECGSTAVYSIQLCIHCNHMNSGTENGAVVHPHSFTRKEPQAPTCQQQGIKVWFECENCGYDVMETEAALGHVRGQEIYQESGNSTWHYRVCQREGCQERIYESHRYSWTIEKYSTCTTAGSMKGVCSDCGYSCTKDTSFGHRYDAGYVSKEPTCTKTGIRTHACTVCGSKTYVDISPLGCDFQNYQLTGNIENPCEHKGACVRCGNENYETIHNEGGWQLTNNANNKCEFSKECSRCQKTAYKTEHDFDGGRITVEPTCTEEGKKLYTCQRCETTKDTVLSALGHNYDRTEHLEPTCVTPGFSVYRCGRCEDERTEAHAMYGHDKEYLYNINDHWRHCARCGEVFTKRSAHSFEAKVKEEVNAQRTSYTYILYESCEFCGYEKTIGEIAHVHTGASIIHVVSPTCTEAGYLAGLKCSVAGCGEIFIQPEPVAALGHTYTDGVCTRCGDGRVCEDLVFAISDDGSYYIVMGRGSSCQDQHIVIPSEYENKPVKEITQNAFYDTKNLLSVTIPSSVETIGMQAFCNCSTLTTVRFAANSKLSYIGKNAFYGCTSLQSIEIPASVTDVGSAAFYNCDSLAEVILAEGGKLTYLSDMMFQECSSLERIVIPAYIETICYQAFDDCTGLRQILFAPDSKLTSIEGNAFYGCISLQSIEIPANVTSVGKGVFYNCKGLKSVTFAEGCKLTYLSDMMFQQCSSLESIVIPAYIERLNYQAFDQCTRLIQVIFAENSKLTSIGENAFYGCTSLKSIEIPANVTSLGRGVFYECKGLKSVTFAEGCKLTYFSNMMFQHCTSLESIVIPAHIETLNYQAFCQCTSLTQVIFAETSRLTSIGENVFYGCRSLQSIEIPASVTSIGEAVFYDCDSLVSVTFAEGSRLTSLSTMLFQDCNSLEEIVLPKTLTSIGEQAFYKCYALTVIKFGGTVAQWSGVSKGTHWNSNTGDYTVICTNGNAV